jgi:hypothetical protein
LPLRAGYEGTLYAIVRPCALLDWSNWFTHGISSLIRFAHTGQ